MLQQMSVDEAFDQLKYALMREAGRVQILSNRYSTYDGPMKVKHIHHREIPRKEAIHLALVHINWMLESLPELRAQWSNLKPEIPPILKDGKEVEAALLE